MRGRAQAVRIAGLLVAAAALALASVVLGASGDVSYKRCVDSVTGPESCGRTADALDGANGVAISPNGRDAYVPAIFDDSLIHMRLSQGKGKLRPIDSDCIDDDEGADTCPRQAKALDGVGSATVSPDGRFVYTTSSDRAIGVFKRNGSTGRLKPKGCIEDDADSLGTCVRNAPGLLGVNGLAITPDGRAAYSSSGSDDAITMFRRNRRSGNLKPLGCVEDGPRSLGPDSSGCSTTAGGLNTVVHLIFSPGARSLYYAGSSSDTVGRMKIKNNRKLAPAECVADVDTGTGGCAIEMQGLDGPADLALATKGSKRLYVAVGNGTEHSVAILRPAGKDGRLKPKECLADEDAGPPGCPREADGLVAISGIALSPDERQIYARASIDDSLVTLGRSRKSGRLEDRGCIADDDAPFPGSDCDEEANTLNGGGPISVSPNGRWLFTVSQIEDAVSVFRRAP